MGKKKKSTGGTERLRHGSPSASPSKRGRGPFLVSVDVPRLLRDTEKTEVLSLLEERRTRITQEIIESGADEHFVEFLQEEGRTQWIPSGLTKQQRAAFHTLAGKLGWSHESQGVGDDRVLVLTKKPLVDDVLLETLSLTRYLGLSSGAIDVAARKDIESVDAQFISNRVQRDQCEENHVTILNMYEVKSLFDDDESLTKKSLLEKCQEILKDDWSDEGLGTIIEGDNQVFYKVLSWPSADLLRVELGLSPATFHITVGFKQSDIHGVKKNKKTLVKATAR
eukprot:TRINITY_DN25_c3_g1_i1.p1 TRINITY_DN25_c3_g1~~TRINITY_DN25_c3_g1_i1.p1  ORF type:complete len:281 (-),score=51.68 TRINITY_DN25_c3_g1_i1:130-972(-)